MSDRRPPRREGSRRPQGPGSGSGPGSGPRPRKPGQRPGPGDASRPPRREAQGAKTPYRPGDKPRPPRREAQGTKPPFRPRPPRPDARPERPERRENSPDSDRLQKVLAHAGIGSRRACEEFIIQGRVAINGQIVRELGTKVVAGRDRIAVDGKPIQDERPAYIAVNKPKGYVSTNDDPSGRPRVVDLVPDIPQRVYTVGRLDEMSVGLMLLTNDGELANRLAHPKFGVEKVYRAVVAGTPDNEIYQKLVEGVWLAEGKVRAKRVRPVAHKGDATVVELVLAEGKNREVRRMFAKLGHKVMTLTRVAVGPITLKGLKPGGWRFLTAYEVDLLRKVADGMPVPTGRMNNDRTLRPPTRGPRAPQHQTPDQATQGRPTGPPTRPQSSGRPQPPRREERGGPAQRPRLFQGGPEGQEGRGPGRPLPPRPQGLRPSRPGSPQASAEGSGPRPGRPLPPRPQGPPSGPRRSPVDQSQDGPPVGRPQPPRPPSGPMRPQGSPQGQVPRPPSGPLRPQGFAQGQGPRPPSGPPRPQGQGPRPPSGPRRPHGGNAGQGPRPGRPQPPRSEGPPQRPPTRRIIGLELPSEPPPSMRRPTPRPRPGGPAPTVDETPRNPAASPTSAR